jgi:hypothetical protein
MPSSLKRRLFNLAFNVAAAASLGLCLTTAALWVRSNSRGDVLSCSWIGISDHSTTRWEAIMYTGRGGIELSVSRLVVPQPHRRWGEPGFEFRKSVRLKPFYAATSPSRRWWNLSAFSYFFERQRWGPVGDSDQVWLDFPLWLLLLIFLKMPVLALRAELRRRRRYGSGCCPTCGYDLRATPERCPECGTATARAAAATAPVRGAE